MPYYQTGDTSGSVANPIVIDPVSVSGAVFIGNVALDIKATSFGESGSSVTFPAVTSSQYASGTSGWEPVRSLSGAQVVTNTADLPVWITGTVFVSATNLGSVSVNNFPAEQTVNTAAGPLAVSGTVSTPEATISGLISGSGQSIQLAVAGHNSIAFYVSQLSNFGGTIQAELSPDGIYWFAATTTEAYEDYVGYTGDRDWEYEGISVIVPGTSWWRQIVAPAGCKFFRVRIVTVTTPGDALITLTAGNTPISRPSFAVPFEGFEEGNPPPELAMVGGLYYTGSGFNDAFTYPIRVDKSGSIIIVGPTAPGSPALFNPVSVAGYDGANVRRILTDDQGRVIISGTVSVSSSAGGAIVITGTVGSVQSGSWTVTASSITNPVIVTATLANPLTVVTSGTTSVSIQGGAVTVNSNNGAIGVSGSVTTLQGSVVTASVPSTVTVTATLVNPLSIYGSVLATQNGGWNVGTVGSITAPVTVTSSLANPLIVQPSGNIQIVNPAGTSLFVNSNSGSLGVSGTVSAVQSGTWTVQSISTTVTVSQSNIPSGTFPITGTIHVDNTTLAVNDNSLSLTVDSNLGALGVSGTVSVSNLPAVQPVSDNSTSLTVDSNLGSLGISGTVTANQGGTWNVGTVASITAPVSVTATLANPITVLGTASVSNMPSNLTVNSNAGWLGISGTVSASQTGTWNIGTVSSIVTPVIVTSSLANPIIVTGTVHYDNTQIAVSNFPISQLVSGSVGVTNFPDVQTVAVSGTASVYITNKDASQTIDTKSGSIGVTGSVTASQGGAWDITNIINPAVVTASLANPVTTRVTGTVMIDHVPGSAVTIDSENGPIGVTGSVTASQGGNWDIRTVTNPVTVTASLANPVSVSLTGTGFVSASQNGTWNIGTVTTVSTVTNPVTVTSSIANPLTVVGKNTLGGTGAGESIMNVQGALGMYPISTWSTNTAANQPVSVRVSNGTSFVGLATETTLGKLVQVTGTSISSWSNGMPVVGGIVTSAAPSFGNSTINALSLDTAGNLRVTPGIVVVTASLGSPVTVSQTGTIFIDNAVGSTITVDSNGGSLGVTGSVTASQGGTWNINSLGLITNAVTVTASQANPVWTTGSVTVNAASFPANQTVNSNSGSLGVTGSVTAAQGGTWNVATLTTITNTVPVSATNFPWVGSAFGVTGIDVPGVNNASRVISIQGSNNAVPVSATLINTGSATAVVAKLVDWSSANVNPASIENQTNGSQRTKITDGTSNAAVKAASVAATAIDPALVVAISPNNRLFGITETVTVTASTSAPMSISGPVTANQGGVWTVNSITAPVTVTATLGSPLTVNHSGTVYVDNANGISLSVDSNLGSIGVSGTIIANQGGSWNLGTVTSVTNPVTVTASSASPTSVAVIGTPNVSISNTPTVTANQGGTWNVGTVTTLGSITNTVTVSQSNTPAGTQMVTGTIKVENSSLAVNDSGSSLTVDSNLGSLGVSGTITANQGGTWNVNAISNAVTVTASLANPLTVSTTGTVLIDAAPGQSITVDSNSGSIGVSGSVTANQGGSWTIATVSNLVGIQNTVTVSQSNTPAGTQTVAGTVAFSNTSIGVTDNGGALTVDSNAGALGVSGTVSANQAGTWNIGTVTAVNGVVTVTSSMANPAWTMVTGVVYTDHLPGTSITIDSYSGSIGVTGSVNAAQAGTWNVGNLSTITNPVTVTASAASPVTVSGTGIFLIDHAPGTSITVDSFNGAIGVTGTVQATQNGTWNIGTVDTITSAVTVTASLSAPLTVATTGVVYIDHTPGTSITIDSANGPIAVSGTLNATASFQPLATSTILSYTPVTSSVTLRTASPTRKQLLIFNNSAGNLFVALATTATTSSFTVVIPPSGYYELPTGNGIYTGIVAGTWSTVVAGTVSVTEVTV